MIRRYKKKYIALIAVFVVIIAAIVFFVQFTSIGFRMTVPLRSFTEAVPNVYIHEGFTRDMTEVLHIVGVAKRRVAEYFKETKSIPIIIICDDAKTIKKLGGDHDIKTLVFFKVYSYIVVSSEYLNVDIVAHEMTHAEVYYRIFKGKICYQSLISTWFDEGLALQNDYREDYNEDAWQEATDNGKNVIDLNEINTAAKFYAEELEERKYRYIVSKHELNGWVERNGVDVLIDLLDKVNQGKKFNDLYFAK